LKGTTAEEGRNHEEGPQRVRMGEPKVGRAKAPAPKDRDHHPDCGDPTYADNTYRSEVHE